jgi:hypothetical protein
MIEAAQKHQLRNSTENQPHPELAGGVEAARFGEEVREGYSSGKIMKNSANLTNCCWCNSKIDEPVEKLIKRFFDPGLKN